MTNITATATQAELEARDFAAQFPTANVLEAIRLCESGRLNWGPVRDLFAKSLGAAMAS